MAGSVLCRADLCSDCVLDHFGSFFYIQKRFRGEEVVFGPCRSCFLILLASWALSRSYPSTSSVSQDWVATKDPELRERCLWWPSDA